MSNRKFEFFIVFAIPIMYILIAFTERFQYNSEGINEPPIISAFLYLLIGVYFLHKAIKYLQKGIATLLVKFHYWWFVFLIFELGGNIYNLFTHIMDDYQVMIFELPSLVLLTITVGFLFISFPPKGIILRKNKIKTVLFNNTITINGPGFEIINYIDSDSFAVKINEGNFEDLESKLSELNESLNKQISENKINIDDIEKILSNENDKG